MKIHFFLLSFLCYLSLTSCSCPYHEAVELLQFKQQLTKHTTDSFCSDLICPNFKMLYWNRSTTNCCKWNGVTCDSVTGHVIGLDLSSSQIYATIYANSSFLYGLSHLQELNLAYNNFQDSEIPSDVGLLASLTHLNLSQSGFSGKVPSSILLLRNLVSLDLSNGFVFQQDMFAGLLQNLTKLEVLSIPFAYGTLKMPMHLSASLRYLDFQYAGLNGSLSDNLFYLPNLQILRLNSNSNLTGTIPEFNSSSSLVLSELDLTGTAISGQLPSSIGNLKSLKFLRLSGCKFHGLVPQSIGNLTQLIELDFRDNLFSGIVPSSVSNLHQLTRIDLSLNNFQGQIPSLFNLTEVESIDLSGNMLNGLLHYSSNASKLQKLATLRLFDNSLSGRIPSWMFSLPSLTELDISSNHLSGSLDDEIITNSVLYVLSLANNFLHGLIPPLISKFVALSYLDLSSNKLYGDVTIKVFSNMTKLSSVDLSHNGISWDSNDDDINITFSSLHTLDLSSCKIDNFPSIIRRTEQLKSLDLSDNEIHGRMPKWFREMKWQSWDSTAYVNISYNFLTGLDKLNWSGVGMLDLQFNMFQGHLTPSICNVTNLQALILSHNNFIGPIPECLTDFWQLWILDLRYNNFQGIIPKFSEYSMLKSIDFQGNQLEGPLPRSLVNCTSLEFVNVGNNLINDTFPLWLATHWNLQVIVLRSNRFHGTIRIQHMKSPFPALRIMDLSDNGFGGLLPVEFVKNLKAMMTMDRSDGHLQNMMTRWDRHGFYYEDSVSLVIKGQSVELERITTIFTTIDFSRNKFEGVIPQVIGNLKSLVFLNLSHNNLSGHIPAEMGNLSMLESLDLSWNRLTGRIPDELKSLTYLSILNLSQNHLAGKIPQDLQFNTFQNDSYGGNFDLCGFPLTKKCGNSSASSHVTPPLVLEHEDESEFESGLSWRAVFIGYSCGLILGLLIGHLIFRTQKPRWFVSFFIGTNKIMLKNTMSRGQRG